ncbi:unnamed protein product [Spirodela intermedia]|uniref:Srp40 C-terminal domain-containing protein n=1 Tax=Spirodela intermedia TaxID=51605 RepID=A0A7I8K8B0_SPIIN|nr:unnamed protein product [Spirodela intermedia]
MLCDLAGEVGSVGTSSLISFVPRQVMLECSTVRSDRAVLAEKSKKGRKKREEEDDDEKSNSPHVTAALVRAIASFLEGNGFSRTLTALRSEAQLEVDDGCKVPVLDLKHMVCKYLELSDDAAVEKADNQSEQVKVVQYNAPQEEKEGCVQDHHEKPISKKKKRKSKEASDQVGVESEKFASENGVVLQNQVKELLPERRALPLEVASAESQLPEGRVKKSKDQKKKKSKESDETINPVEERVENVCPLLDSASHMLLESSDRSKDKKKSDRKKKKEEQKSSKSTSNEINSEVAYKISQEEEGKTDSQITDSLSENPKTVNAFQRVKVDAVKFADDRLQDNSYWAKAGAETGYGAKAQEILGQVRGRDFRHEKTKKKRGSYRGGQIDFQSHSVKFQYSDEDE